MKIAMTMLLAMTLFGTGAVLAEVSGSVKGVVLETMNSGGYTYLRLKTKTGETWAAVNRASVGKGDEVTVENVMEMKDFESRSLKKTFPTILFGQLSGSAGRAMPRPRTAPAATPAAPDEAVAKAGGANARTVAEIMGKGQELKDKTVRVRAKVVKYNPGIMGRNWLHLRDGTGSAADGSNDLLVTTAEPARAGEIVTAQGVVRLGKDFGAGYAYSVMVEEAKLSR